MAVPLTAERVDRLVQIERLVAGGFVLVTVPQGTKGPTTKGWNTDPAQWLTTSQAARAYLTAQPDGGVGLLHSQSGTCTLDLDSEHAARALAAVGVDLAALMDNPYRVVGRRGEKPVWRVPHGLSLKMHALSWPHQSKKGPGGRPAAVTIFELRAGPVQDVMPPSIHPEGVAYTWAGPIPHSVADLPELPTELLGLWERWAALESVMKGACPWAVQEPPPPPPRALERLSAGIGVGESVVDAFNAARTVGEVLNTAGYRGPERGPWLYPHSSSGAAGVRLRPERTPRGAEVVMSWHAADPLGDGQPRDAFGVWALLEHGTDLYTATPEQRRDLVKSAARLLGLPERSAGGQAATSAATQPTVGLPPLPDWGEVSALPPVTELVPSLPLDLLPQPLAGWIEDEARAAGLPLEMIAGPVMVGAGGLIGARLSLRNARNTPAVPPNLWGVVCGPPSVKKTHAVKVGAAGLERAQRAEFDRLDTERGELETARDMAAARLDALQGRIKGAAKGGKNAPVMPDDQEVTEARQALSEAESALMPARCLVNDPTVEKLGEIMRDNPQGVTLVRDELSAWLGSFERAGREADRGFWLEAANGTGSHTVDRLARGTVFIPKVCAGVLGTLQPGPLADILDTQRGAGDGLLQRFQVFVWPDTFPPFDQAAQRLPLDAGRQEGAAQILDALPGLTLAELGSRHPSGDGAPLTYTSEGQAVYDSWEVEHAAAVRDMTRGEAYRAHLGKQPGTFARLALIFHALDIVSVGGSAYHPHPAQVGEEAALLAAGWCEYLSAHARKLWGEGRRRDVLDAREVLRFMERQRVRDGQKLAEARAVLAEGKAGMTGPRLLAALSVLEECGAVRVVTPPPGVKGGRPSPLLRIHPQALAALDDQGADL